MSRSAEHDARNATFRGALTSTDAARAAMPPTAVTIEACSKKLNRPWQVDNVPDSEGAKIHWVGNRTSHRVILYFHGGGYGLGAFDGHVIFLAQCADRLAEAGKETAVAFSEYSLTKKVRYPTQLKQATEALRFILKQGYKPSDIVVGGDSAGGNLAIALMSHILRPHPDIPPLTHDDPLAGFLFISPWVIFNTNAPSFKENEHRDVYGKASLYDWADDFAPAPTDRNNYTEPLRADASWWSGKPARSILNLAGEYEMFRDDIQAFRRNLEKAKLNVKMVTCPMQVHVDCILDAQSGLEHGQMWAEIWGWLDTVFTK